MSVHVEETMAVVRSRLAEHRQAIESLEALEKGLAMLLDGRPAGTESSTDTHQPPNNHQMTTKESPPPVVRAKTPPAASKASNPKDQVLTKREKVVAYLMANGPKPKAVVAEKCGIGTRGMGAIGSVLDGCEWFHTNPDGIVSLTEKGERDNPLLRNEK